MALYLSQIQSLYITEVWWSDFQVWQIDKIHQTFYCIGHYLMCSKFIN